MMNAHIEHHVGWNATLAIWWEQLWRVILVNVILYALANASIFLTPVFYNGFREMFKYEEQKSVLLIILGEMIISLWAVRESLVDRYSRFTLIAESKTAKLNVFGLDRRLSWPMLISVWWAQMWRMLLVPATAVLGSFAALMAKHPNAANYTHMIPPALLNICFYAVFAFSLWAARESLADRYRTFRLIARPKTFYSDGTNT